MSELRTERLVLSPVAEDDADFVLALLSDPGWLANIGDRDVRTVEQARAYIADRFSASLWLVARDAGSGEPLGLCGVVAKRFGLEHSDLGYAFLACHSGRGYATEAARAVLAYALGPMGHARMMAFTKLENLPSQAVLLKIGFRREADRRLPDHEDDSAVFST